MPAAITRRIIEIIVIIEMSMNVLFILSFFISPRITVIKRILPASAAAK